MAGCLAIIGLLLLGQAAAPQGLDVKTVVEQLVRQLDAPQLAQREAAEAELIRRGPAVLDLLPSAGNRPSAEVEQRLGRIRQELQHAAADAWIRSSAFTFRADAIRLSKILHGETGGRLLTITVEASWDPHLLVIFLKPRMADVHASDQRGDSLPVADADAQPEISVDGAASTAKFDVPLRLSASDVKQIAGLKGKLSVTMAGRMETFRFDRLADAKNRRQRIAGVTVTLGQVRRSGSPHPGPLPKGEGTDVAGPHPDPLPKGEGTRWEIDLRVRFDDAGDALASHRQWIFNNPAYLEGPDGKPIAYDTFETTAQSQNELGIAYSFRTDRPLEELTFIYKTPGTIVTRDFPYELGDIKLPR
jgi:hypothetical protein